MHKNYSPRINAALFICLKVFYINIKYQFTGFPPLVFAFNRFVNLLLPLSLRTL